MAGVEVFYMPRAELKTWLETEDSVWAHLAACRGLEPDEEEEEEEYPLDAPPRRWAGAAREMAGWYYWYCFPGCMPDSDPVGPFGSYDDAAAEAKDDTEGGDANNATRGYFGSQNVLDSDTVLAMDITELADLVSSQTTKYRPTDAERSYLERFAHNWLPGLVLSESVGDDYMTIDPSEVSRALAQEGLDRLPCLCENTALQRIVWAIGPEEGWEE